MTENLKKAQAYYKAMAHKEFDELASYLHPNVSLLGPLATMRGKESIVEAAKNFSMAFKGLTIREVFKADDNNKVMLVLDFDCHEPIGAFRGASFLSFDKGLIACIELFYDARPFEKKKDDIFKQK